MPQLKTSEAELHALFGNALAKRGCGGCVACCVGLHIETPPELRKEAGVPCRHLVDGGCGIYETRPNLCRVWHCLWRLGPLPDMARPDRCGVIFSFETIDTGPFGRHFFRGVAMNSLDDFRHPAAKLIVEKLIATEDYPIMLRFGDTRTLVFPDEALADAILNPQTTPHRYLLEKAEKLRSKWLPDAVPTADPEQASNSAPASWPT